MNKTPPIDAAPATEPAAPWSERTWGGWKPHARKPPMSQQVIDERHAELLELMAGHGFGPRNEDGKTTKAFAERVGFSYGTMRQWTSGARTPSRYALRTIRYLLTSDGT